MKTSAITRQDLSRSVWAVPPLSLDDAGRIRPDQNERLAAHIEAGGVSTLLWGGNANIYGMTAALFAELVAAIPDWAGADTWAIPSVGPDYGKLMDQAAILKGSGFPAAMLLPYAGARDVGGTERAIRDFADAAGMPAILYIRAADYLPPDRIARLVDDGTVVALKYAVETGDRTRDPYLSAILSETGRERIVSGIGEIAAVPHLRTFGLPAFTAGAVCIAPRRAMAILDALQAEDYARANTLCQPIEPLERLREVHGAIQVIHDAVTLSGVADMGRLTPHFSHVSAAVRAEIAAAVAPLLEAEDTLAAA